MTIEKVKSFMEDFFAAEAKVGTLIFKPNLEEYNEALTEMHTFTADFYFGRMGYVTEKELKNDSFYENAKNDPPQKPRFIFKISKYTHSAYGDIWVVYTSGRNPRRDPASMGYAYFVSEVEGKLLVVRDYIYSNYDSDGEYYQWEACKGYNDLTFDSLEGPSKIVRYIEPKDYCDGLEMYNENR